MRQSMYRFTGFSECYERDVLRMLTDSNYLGPPPTTGCAWRDMTAAMTTGTGVRSRRNTIGRYLTKRHGSYAAYKSIEVPLKQMGNGAIRCVWNAYRAGNRTTAEVAAMTGLGIKKSSAYTSMLVSRGHLRARLDLSVNDHVGRGSRHYWYEPVASETSER